MKKKTETIEEKLMYREPMAVTEIKELGMVATFLFVQDVIVPWNENINLSVIDVVRC